MKVSLTNNSLIFSTFITHVHVSQCKRLAQMVDSVQNGGVRRSGFDVGPARQSTIYPLGKGDTRTTSIHPNQHLPVSNLKTFETMFVYTVIQ